MFELRPLRVSDLETILEWRNAPSVRKNMYTQDIISIEQHRAWWSDVSLRDDKRYYICEEFGVAVGVVAFTDINFKSCNASWAFYADPNARKGTGSSMELLALDHAFLDMKLHKLYCEVLSFNHGVISMHKKFGFNVEGTFVQQFKNENGYSDVVRLAIFQTDWAVKRSEIIQKLNRYK